MLIFITVLVLVVNYEYIFFKETEITVTFFRGMPLDLNQK